MHGENKVTITFIADKEVMQQVRELQKKTDTFSRSELIRRLMVLGLKSLDEDGQAV